MSLPTSAVVLRAGNDDESPPPPQPPSDNLATPIWKSMTTTTTKNKGQIFCKPLRIEMIPSETKREATEQTSCAIMFAVVGRLREERRDEEKSRGRETKRRQH